MTATCLARLRFLLPLFLFAGFSAGCGPSSRDPAHPREGAVTPEGGSAPSAQASAVELRIVTFKELEKAIQAQKGNIVVMDVWATWCLSCKKEFPHLVELRQKLNEMGVVCVSVSVDDEKDRPAALTFLQSQKALFPNFLLNEEASVWQEHWNIKGIPVVYVYGRDGKLVRKFDNDDPDNQFSYEDVTKLVNQLIARKT